MQHPTQGQVSQTLAPAPAAAPGETPNYEYLIIKNYQILVGVFILLIAYVSTLEAYFNATHGKCPLLPSKEFRRDDQ
jgi:hypothetical protein